jgi:multiple sugar transport system ATP-binding protein
MAEVTLSNLSKRFGDTLALQGINLTVPDGSFVVLLGPTGAGKTTTLRLIAGLEKPDTGSITIAGRDVARDMPAERNVAMVFQQYSLYPHLTVRENLAFPLRSPMIRMAEAAITTQVNQVAEVLRIAHKLDNKATNLSGGEMQRVSIGRALVRRPSIYLMDEPLSSLDAKLRSDLRVELKRIQADLGATMLYVTHDQIEAMTMATHVGVLDQGRLVQFGSPREVYENPVSSAVAARLGCPPICSGLPLPGPRSSACAPNTWRSAAIMRPQSTGSNIWGIRPACI